MDKAFTKPSKYCKITFLAFPRLAYIICNRLVMSKTTLLRQKSQQTNSYFRISTMLAKAYQLL